jgi:sugar (pentulose or hexulose) kinase
MTEQILIYDVGTTSVKTIIFDRNGMEIESVSIPYPTYYQHDCAEQNPDDFWQAAITGTKRLSPSVKEHIVSIGISGHMNGALFLDKQGQSVRPELISHYQRFFGSSVMKRSPTKRRHFSSIPRTSYEENLRELLEKVILVTLHFPVQ